MVNFKLLKCCEMNDSHFVLDMKIISKQKKYTFKYFPSFLKHLLRVVCSGEILGTKVPVSISQYAAL